MSLAQDPRWRRFTDRDRSCPCCGRHFGGIFDLAFDHPDAWPHGNRSTSGQELLRHGDDWLSADYCVLGDWRFVRCILPIPVPGAEVPFAYGAWGSVRAEHFDRISGPDGDEFGGCFAWLCNALPGWDTAAPLPCDLLPRDPGLRAELHVHQGSGHPLAAAQRTGISFDRLLDIYAAAGHDLRPHLTDA